MSSNAPSGSSEGAGAAHLGVNGTGMGNGANTNPNGGPGVSGGAASLPPSPYLSKELPTSATPSIPQPGSAHSSASQANQAAFDPRGAQRATSTGSPPPPAFYAAAPAPAASTSTSSTTAPSAPTASILVKGLPRDVTVEKLANYFGEFGQLKMDRSKDPPVAAITILRESASSTSEAILVWDSPEHAPLAVEYFNGKHWPGGGSITVSLSYPTPPPQPAQHMPAVARNPVYEPPTGPAYGPPPAHQYPPQPAPHVAPPPQHGAMPYPPPGMYAPPQPYGAPPPGYGPQPTSAYDPRNYDPYYGQQAPPQQPPTAALVPPPHVPPHQPPYDPMVPHAGVYPAGPPTGRYPNYPPPAYSAPNYYPGAPQPSYQQPPHHHIGGGGGGAFNQFKGKGGAARAGDWICPSCKNNNFSWRTTCKQCNISRPVSAAVVDRDEEGGPPRRPPRDPSTHPDSVNDWPCPKCGFRNFSKREFCHDCKFPKPYHPPMMTGPMRYGGAYDRTGPY